MKQNKLILFFLSLIFNFGFSYIHAQNLNCEKFKVGEFNYVDKNYPISITRTPTTQIEKHLIDGTEMHCKIQWKSDCEFILTYKKLVNFEEDLDYLIGEKIFVKIIKTDGNKFTVHAKSEAIDHDIEFIKVDLYN